MPRLLILQAFVSAGLLLAGMILFNTPGLSTAAVGLLVASGLSLLSAFVIAIRAERLARWKSIAWGVAITLCLVLTYSYLGWWNYSHRPKPDTVGFVEFDGRAVFARFDLPEGWRVTYNIRGAPHSNQGRIKDEQGHVRLTAYMGLMEPGPHASDLDAYARWKTEGLRKAGLDPDGMEYRETPRGRCWVYWRKAAKGDPVFGKQPGLYVQYAERRGSTVLIFDFDMPAAQDAELLPLTWQFVRTAEVHGPGAPAEIVRPNQLRIRSRAAGISSCVQEARLRVCRRADPRGMHCVERSATYGDNRDGDRWRAASWLKMRSRSSSVRLGNSADSRC